MNVFAKARGDRLEPERPTYRHDRHPITDNGRRLAERLRPVLAKETFALVLVSPMQRSRETCDLAGLGDRAAIGRNLMEWNYGKYKGLAPKQINEIAPGWLIFRDECPGARHPNKSAIGWIE